MCRRRCAQRGSTKTEFHAILLYDINRIIPGDCFKRFCNRGICLESVSIRCFSKKGIDAFFGKLQLFCTMIWFYDPSEPESYSKIGSSCF